MTQTTVNFVTDAQVQGTGSQSTVVTQSQTRAFDGQVSQQAQLYFESQLETMQNAQSNINAEVAGGATITSSDPNVIAFYTALQNLNQWTTMSTVSPDGQTQTNLPFVGIDSSGNITFTSGSGTTQLTTTMDRYMATGLEQINRALLSSSLATPGASAFDINTDIATSTQNMAGLTSALSTIATQAESTTSPDLYGLQAAFTAAATAAQNTEVLGATETGTDNIQQALMTDFVDAGNTILNNQMSELNSAINVNQQVLSYLNSLQDLMNQKDPTQFMLQLQNLSATQLTNTEAGGNVTLPYTDYDNFENNTFNQTIGANPTFTVDPGGTTSGTTSTPGSNTLASQKAANPNALFAGAFVDTANISDPANATAFTYSTEQIVNNLTTLISQVQAAGGSTSQSGGLVSALTTVLNDFQPEGTGSAPSTLLNLQTWVEDQQAGSSGQYQNDLSAAITSSQSFNDTQRENLNEVMFVFEEFYQSAGGLLSSLDQLIQEIGKNAGS